ncbi:MAG: DUF1559 family PulG-like putative transporter [Planctomycetaceae bacterium]
MYKVGPWLLAAFFALHLAGCGDGDSGKKKKESDGAAAAVPKGLPAGGAAPAMPMGAGGVGGIPGGPRFGGARSSSADSDGGELAEVLQYLPGNLKIVAGANLSLLGEKHPLLLRRIVMQFQPVMAVLARGKIKAESVGQLWCGNNRESGDLLICVQTTENYDSTAVNLGLEVLGEPEKIGKATVFTIGANPAFKNAVAHVDGRTLLLGRYDSITAGLKNPVAGSARLGLEALGAGPWYYWLGGDEASARQRLSAIGLDSLAGSPLESLKTEGWAMGLGAPGAGAAALPGAPGQLPPEMMSFASSFGFSAADVADYAANAAESPPGAQRAAGGAPRPQNLSFAIGLKCASEALAQTFEQRFDEWSKARAQSASAPNPAGGPPGLPPGLSPETLSQLSSVAGGAMSVLARTSSTLPALPALSRKQADLRFSLTLPALGDPRVARMINAALQASGASALNDGLYDGTLTLLGDGLRQWPNAASGRLRGVRRVGDRSLREGYSWMVELLPFVGYGELYTLFDFNKSWTEKENRLQTFATVPAFLNPADPRTHWEGRPHEGMALTHFVGVSGIEDRRGGPAAALPRSDPRAGVFGYDEVARLSDVTDGASQTIMVVGSGAVQAPWVQGGGATIRGARPPYFDKYTGFGSRGLAPHGAYVLMVDGSARVVSADIDPDVFKAMCTIHGAEQIDLSKQLTQDRN